MVNRKITYRLYPSQTQAESLACLHGLHQRVYNEALEARIRVYKEEKRSLTFASQCKELTKWRKACDELSQVNAQSLQVTLKRLDLAFQAFYRRVKNGEKPGFPRFKSSQRFCGWGYKTHGDGWRLLPGEGMQHGHVRISSVGKIRMRGKARTLGEPKTCEIVRKSQKWYLSVTIACAPKRSCGKKAIGFDWGVQHFLKLHDNLGKTQTIDNPRYLKTELLKLKTLQQSVSRKKDKATQNRKKAVIALSKKHAQIANKRKDFNHQQAAKIVKENGLIAAEALSIKKMTSKGNAQKRGLNREILSTAPTQFYQLLKAKAEEAGALWIDIPTREVKPSQTCYGCGMQKKKSLNERWHTCECGASCDRDENAARVILNWALRWASGQELAEMGSRSGFTMLNQETPTIP